MTDQIVVGIAIGVAAPVVWLILRVASRWMARTISGQVVDAIGDSLQRRWRLDIDDALGDALEPIHAELKTNGGTSLKDQVSSIGIRLGNIESQLGDGRHSQAG
jgi:predicted ThiF/HesA family dinucleotide-utilizing enzyme